MKIYLASPLFTDYERQKVKEWAARLRGCGREVYVPMEHSIENAWELPNYEWAKKVFDEDVKAMAAVMKAKENTRGIETNHYKACFDAARSEFGDKPFTVVELEELVDHRISKNSVASMVAFAKTPESVKVRSNKKNRRTERLLPSDLKDTGECKKVEYYYLRCDASGKPIEGAELIQRTSKGSKLYKFGD